MLTRSRLAWHLGPLLLSLTTLARAQSPTPTPPPLRVALFGDSITRAVNADQALGQQASLGFWDGLNKVKFNAATAQYLPEGQAVLAYPVMLADEFTARDSIGAVQGDEPYALKQRLAQATGRSIEITDLARLGGSYRYADSQLSLYKSVLATSQPADLIIVDLGRTDFALYATPEVFAQEVEWFFAKLTALNPKARLLVTRIPDLVGLIDRPDRIAFYGPVLGWQTCAALANDSRFGGATGLKVGADNSAFVANARSRLAAYNAVLERTLEAYQQAGAQVRLIDSLNERPQPDQWDEILAADCMNLNRSGQAEIADHLYAAATALLAAPTTSSPTPVAVAADAPVQMLSTHGHELWNRYVGRLPLDLQPECRPRLVPPSGAVPYQGMIMLVPGVTACPQLYDDVTDALTAKGYAVVLPLVPGEGRQWLTDAFGKRTDQIDDLATGRIGDPRSYRKVLVGFVQEMNAIAVEFSGQRAVAGISLGGALASAIAIDRPSLWSRQMLLSPAYELGISEVQQAFNLVSTLDRWDSHLVDLLAPKLEERSGYGDFCENWREHRPTDPSPTRKLRAGTCQLRGTNLLGDNQMGYDTWNIVAPTTVQTQVLLVQGDPVINLERPYNAIARMRNEELIDPFHSKKRLGDHPDVRVCFVPSDAAVCKANYQLPKAQQGRPCVSHALLFGYDDPRMTDYWVPDLVPKMVDFLTAGTFFAVDPTIKVNEDPLCSGFPLK